MAYATITTAQIAAGKASDQVLWTKVKTDLDDLDSRVSSVETGAAAHDPMVFDISGEHWKPAVPQTRIQKQYVTFDRTITSGKLTLFGTGTSGTLTVDILYKRGVAAWTSIFSSLPSIAAPGTENLAVAGVLSTTSLLAGDVLALSITSAMVDLTQFQVQLNYSA